MTSTIMSELVYFVLTLTYPRFSVGNDKGFNNKVNSLSELRCLRAAIYSAAALGVSENVVKLI